VNQSPTEELASEHEYVLVVVSAMEREAESIHSGGPVDRDAIAGMVDFTRNFTDGCHHTKEEKLLFPLLEERSQLAAGTVSVLLSEHVAARGCVSAIDENLPQVESSVAARSAVAHNLALYAELLRMHIHKENVVLFPLAEQVLDAPEMEDLATGFARVEKEETDAGVHERYHQMAHELASHLAPDER